MPRPDPHLFLDDRGIEAQQGTTRVVTPPTKLPAPVVTGPEDQCFQPYVSVIRNPATRRFRIWYGVPENASQSHLATMESDDGIRWERPHRVLADPGPIQFGVSILDDGPGAPSETRYKYGWWHDGGLQIAGSPDGLRWKKLAPGPVIRHNHDINNIYVDPIRRRYAANLSMYQTGAEWRGDRRVTWQSVSDDLNHWSEPHRIVWPDARDEGETQFYAMGGVIARGGLLIGLARVLRDDLAAEPGGPVTGLGYSTLCWSHDGRTWERDRTPFLDRSDQPGAWDRAMAWVDCQVPVGDALYLYYGGYRRGHKVERFKERQIGLARMPLDRYVARRGGADGAEVVTRPQSLTGRLTVNARVPRGLKVSALDDAGRPIPGYDALVRGDGIALPLITKRTFDRLDGKRVRLRFQWSAGDLWGFSTLPSTT